MTLPDGPCPKDLLSKLTLVENHIIAIWSAVFASQIVTQRPPLIDRSRQPYPRGLQGCGEGSEMIGFIALCGQEESPHSEIFNTNPVVSLSTSNF